MCAFSPSSCVVGVGVTSTLLGFFTGKEHIKKYNFKHCNLEVRIKKSSAMKVKSSKQSK